LGIGHFIIKVLVRVTECVSGIMSEVV
jgi:hypothetical protein